PRSQPHAAPPRPRGRRIRRTLEWLQRPGAAPAEGFRRDDVGRDRAGAAAAGTGALAGRRAPDTPPATIAQRTHRPSPLRPPRDPVEWGADDTLPPPSACAAAAARADLRRERLDGALFAAPD